MSVHDPNEYMPGRCSAKLPNNACSCSTNPSNDRRHWVFGTDGRNYLARREWDGTTMLSVKGLYGWPRDVANLVYNGVQMYDHTGGGKHILPPGAMLTVAGCIKLPPMHCKRCNECNEYVGKEHLNAAGEYFCRSCKQNPYR